MGTVYLRNTTAPDASYTNRAATLSHADMDNNLTLFVRNDVDDVMAGSLRINGTTTTAGYLNASATTPTGTVRLNYEGYFYPTSINISGTADTATAATHYLVETGSDGFVRPKTLTNVQSEIVTTAVLGSGTANSTTYLAGDRTWKTISGGGATVVDDTTTNATRYILWEDVTSGTSSTIGVSSTKLYFNPSTGTLNSTAFNSLSDATLKIGVSRVENAISTLNHIEGVSFNWKDTGKKSYGVIAQEIEKILPDVVETSDSGVKSVNYSAMTAFLIEAVKELSAEIHRLKQTTGSTE